MRMLPLILLSLAPLLSRADAWRPILLRRDVEVRKEARVDRPAALTLGEGERVWIGEEDGEFTRVRLKRAGAWRRGWVFTEDLLAPAAAARGVASEGGAARTFAVGVLGQYSQMSQPGRQFQTTDMVQWTTSSYESRSAWPALYLQYGRTDFWRLALGVRMVDFKGSARVDVDANTSRAIEVKQAMYSARVEKAFTVYGPAYVSLGGEVARAPSLTETLGGVVVPTTSDDLSVYAGGSLGLGIEWPFLDRLSVVAEGRYAYFPSVKPAARALDWSAGLAYWF